MLTFGKIRFARNKSTNRCIEPSVRGRAPRSISSLKHPTAWEKAGGLLLSGLSPTAWEFMLACYCEYHVIRIAMCCGSLRSRITRLHCPCQASVSGHFPLQKKNSWQSTKSLTFTKNLRRLPSYIYRNGLKWRKVVWKSYIYIDT